MLEYADIKKRRNKFYWILTFGFAYFISIDNLFTVISPLIAAMTTLLALGSMLLSNIKTSPSLMCGSIERPETRQKKVAVPLVISSSLRVNLLGRFAEQRLGISCADALIIEVEGAVYSAGDLLKLHG